jgi:hypothetical protein
MMTRIAFSGLVICSNSKLRELELDDVIYNDPGGYTERWISP